MDHVCLSVPAEHSLKAQPAKHAQLTVLFVLITRTVPNVNLAFSSMRSKADAFLSAFWGHLEILQMVNA